MSLDSQSVFTLTQDFVFMIVRHLNCHDRHVYFGLFDVYIITMRWQFGYSEPYALSSSAFLPDGTNTFNSSFSLHNFIYHRCTPTATDNQTNTILVTQ